MTLIDPNPINGEQTLEDRLNEVPMNVRERLEKSWQNTDRLIGPEVKLPEGVGISKVECETTEDAEKTSKEIYDFLAKVFGDDECADPVQIQIGIENKMTDNYIARDEQGRIISFLQSSIVENISESGQPELSMLIWYLESDKKLNKGGPKVTQAVASAAFSDLLKKSKDELKPIRALATEADFNEPRLQTLFNVYPGLNRVFVKREDGSYDEVRHNCPPEDESFNGIPEHFMIRVMDGSDTISKKDYMQLSRVANRQYTDKRYFSREATAYAIGIDDPSELDTPLDVDKLASLGLDKDIMKLVRGLANRIKMYPEDISQLPAYEQYYLVYSGVVADIEAEEEKFLEGPEDKLVLMNLKTQKLLRKSSTEIRDWE